RAAGAALIINGDARLARDSAADGVHLGGGAGTVEEARAIAGAAAWISVAAHDDATVRAAAIAGADAALVSPIYPTHPPSLHAPAKEGRGLEALRTAAFAIRDSPRLLLYALGGIDGDNARACIEAGARGVAVMRALLASADADLRWAAQRLREAIAGSRDA